MLPHLSSQHHTYIDSLKSAKVGMFTHGNQQTLQVRGEVSGLLNIYHHPTNNCDSSKATSRTGPTSDASEAGQQCQSGIEDTLGQSGLSYWSVELWHQIQADKGKIRFKNNPRSKPGEAAAIVGLGKGWCSAGQRKYCLFQKALPPGGSHHPSLTQLASWLFFCN